MAANWYAVINDIASLLNVTFAKKSVQKFICDMIKEYLFLPKYLTKKTINALLWLKKNMKILNILLTKF